ncbi:hypothetical protein CNMCM5793_000470 [Aspergillus hiratsukae]|uniref:Uncharacterized protein n=1 Tax=Aspergillus hiratsukae TaxID=1194566 RepID=A0A8H6P9M4_9EURO|nr:hypothetical protein CNMCM5793_000470 [Aspergillus hiratsukae]KAF7162066.1 hypothetical protein CNMCM6106_009100 [Aspergillus hiratsukae]
MFLSRDTDYSGHVESDHASSTSTDGSGSGSSSNVTAIIIGVVVGGVAAIAITAGILFFLYKKRRWDRIRRREEQLLSYHTQAGWKADDAELATMAGRPSSSLSAYRAHSADINDRPPAYQTLHVPVYDPSSTQADAPHSDSHLRISMDELIPACLSLYGFATVQQPADEAVLVFGTNLSGKSNGAVLRKEMACAQALMRAFPPETIHVSEPTRTWSEWKSDIAAAKANPRSAHSRIYRSQTTYRMGFPSVDFMREVAEKLNDLKGIEIFELHWVLSVEARDSLVSKAAQSAMRDAGRRAGILARRAGFSILPLPMTDLESRGNWAALPAFWKDDAGGRHLDMEPRMFQVNATVKGNFFIW